MIKHYFKIALRNLLNYKVHSLISVICLAVGITCFCLMNYFIDTVNGKEELPNYEHRIGITFSSSQEVANTYCLLNDITYLKKAIPIRDRYTYSIFFSDGSGSHSH